MHGVIVSFFLSLSRCLKLSSAPMTRCLGAASHWTGLWTGELCVSPCSQAELQPLLHRAEEQGQ